MRSNQLRQVLLIAIVIGTLAAPVFASNSLTASLAAAIDGTYGLEVTMDGSPNKADVRNYCDVDTSSCPNDETVYRVSFKVNMNNLAMNEKSHMNILTVRSRPGGPLALTNRNEARVAIVYRTGQTNPYKVHLICRSDAGSWYFIGQHSLPTTTSRTVTVEWQASSAPGADDGLCRFYINGVLRGENTSIDNDERAIGAVWLGVDGVDPGTVGSMFYDTFESFRTLSP